MVLGNKSNIVKVLSWYDNELSFACRLVDLVKLINTKMNEKYEVIFQTNYSFIYDVL